jgi:formylglycine-generating enzyme required for sulfatase activity
VTFRLIYSLNLSSGHEWKASPTVSDILRRLGQLPKSRLSDANAVGLKVDAVADRVNAIGMQFVWVSPGRFLMGSPTNELERMEGEVHHRVTLSKGFYLGIHPVTQSQWRKVIGTDPSRFRGNDRPVECVSWDDALAFCHKLGEMDGWTYRLPTEAEWEYACRADTTTPFHFGETLSSTRVNYDATFIYARGKSGEYRQQTTPVGIFPPNDWGLHDMHGNVWEWCQDWYAENYYLLSPEIDPPGPNNGDWHVLRGGSWYNRPWHCRSAQRPWLVPEHAERYGFRVVCGE